MTSVDPSLLVGQIQALSSTLQGLGPALAQAAPSGAFASVLDAVQSEMAAIGDETVTGGGTTSTSSGGLSTDDLLGLTGTGSGSGSTPTAEAVPAGGSSSAIPASLGVPASLVPMFEQASAQYGVPASLLAAVAKQESGFDPQAVSSAGAEGLMQLMPSTASGLGVNPYDPQQAIDGAAQLLSSYLQQYNGSVPLSLAAYNAGPGAVAEYGGIPPYTQTQDYVQDITAMLGEAS